MAADAGVDADEYIALTIEEAFVYRIPPRTSAQGHKASDWTSQPQLAVVRVQVVTRGKDLFIKLLRQDTGKLFAVCPIRPGEPPAVEPTMDSSRFFALRIEDGRGNRAFIGLGFNKREDAFDLKSAMADHAKHAEAEERGVDLGLDPSLTEGVLGGLKAGTTISIKLGAGKPAGSAPAPVAAGGGLGRLAPPGSAPASAPIRLRAPGAPAPAAAGAAGDDLLGLGGLSLGGAAPRPAAPAPKPAAPAPAPAASDWVAFD